MYCKPTSYGVNDADYYIPITNVNVQFDNVSGELRPCIFKRICNNNLLRETPKALTTIIHRKIDMRTRLIVEPNGKNVKDIWTIRRETSKAYCFAKMNPQRLHGCKQERSNKSL